jgi:hypothetical protein
LGSTIFFSLASMNFKIRSLSKLWHHENGLLRGLQASG